MPEKSYYAKEVSMGYQAANSWNPYLRLKSEQRETEEDAKRDQSISHCAFSIASNEAGEGRTGPATR